MSNTSNPSQSASPAPSRRAERTLGAVILAAGKGTRMGSDLAKVLHAAAGEPLVRWVVEATRAVDADPIVLVVGHQAESVEALFDGDADIRCVLQREQLGTGHAVEQARKAVLDGDVDDVLVLYGDGPLIRPSTLRTLVERHREHGAAATLATAILNDPTGYGRIVRDGDGHFVAIREQRDASETERAIREVNPGYYCFSAAPLFSALDRVGRGNASGEVYLTDVFEIMLGDGLRVEVVDAVPPEDVLSVNTPEQLATVDAILTRRLAAAGATTGADE